MLKIVRNNFSRFEAKEVKIRKELPFSFYFPHLNIDGIDYDVLDGSCRYFEDEGKLKLRKLGIVEIIPGNNYFTILRT